MIYEVKDRVAVGDDKYTMTTLDDGRIQLTPSPDSIKESGTALNKAFLQPLVDSTVTDIFISSETNQIVGDYTFEDVYNMCLQGKNVRILYGQDLNLMKVFYHTSTMRLNTLINGQIFATSSPQSTQTAILSPTSFSLDDEVFFSDWVVDEGTSGMWTYKKWASGAAECWGVHNTTYTTTMASNGNYAVSGDLNLTFPTGLFLASGVCTNLTALGGGYPDVVISQYTGGSGLTFRLRTEWAVSDMGIWLQCQVRGKWK